MARASALRATADETRRVLPRGGQIWERRADGQRVRVLFRRAVPPLRWRRGEPRDDSWGSMLAFLLADSPERGGVAHTVDFIEDYRFVSGVVRASRLVDGRTE